MTSPDEHQPVKLDALREAWTLLNNAQVGPGNFPRWQERCDRFLARLQPDSREGA